MLFLDIIPMKYSIINSIKKCKNLKGNFLNKNYTQIKNLTNIKIRINRKNFKQMKCLCNITKESTDTLFMNIIFFFFVLMMITVWTHII